MAAVIDGDTLALVDGRRVRLLGLDAPETRHPDMAGPQPFGEAARDRLSDLVLGRTVRLERDVTDRDHFGRTLRHVWLGRRLVAAELVSSGLAHAQPIAPDLRHAGCLRAAESVARAGARGLWGLPRPTPNAVFERP